MAKKDTNCDGCKITDQIFNGYISWKVASTIVALLLIGILASYSYTDRSLIRTEEKIKITNDAQDVTDAELKDSLNRIEVKIDNMHDAVLTLQHNNLRTLNSIKGALSTVDKLLVAQGRHNRVNADELPKKFKQIDLEESPRVISQIETAKRGVITER